ncbi:hypothetical protein ACS0TY_019721 [Phlomoides rotata]
MKFEAVGLSILIIIILTAQGGGGVSLSIPGCPEKCGDVTIPYPFGIGSKCSHSDWFTVTCGQKKPYLRRVGSEVVEVSLENKRVTVLQTVTPLNCSSELKTMSLHEKSLVGSPFSFDSPLAVVGCETEVLLMNLSSNSSPRGCRPICGSATIGCYGINCCRISTAAATGPLQQLQISYRTTDDHHTRVCGYAFLADHKWFRNNNTFRNQSYPFDELHQVHVRLDWEFTPPQAGKGITCQNGTRNQAGLGYNVTNVVKDQCCCESGFEGNPYLPGGCQDINECRTSLRNCTAGTTCVNTVGSFTCQRDEKNKMKSIIIGISSTIGTILLLTGVWKSSKFLRKKFEAYRKNKFFKGLFLQKLSSNDGGAERIKLFSSKDLAQATDQYNENRVLGRGGQGTVYKGMLPCGRIVAVKKLEGMDESDIDTFINEVVILSQINHRNIVKLLGCCLDTEVLLLVHEFVPNGTLFQHIHDQNDEYFPLSWKMRLGIATDVAGALSYLHNAASVPIYHRDIKSTNILLDDKYRAKVSDFGTSRSISIDQTHLTTRVQGTFGYLDPEYFQSSQFTEKSDVYSFGVVMVELLTGKKAISKVRAETGRSLATLFLHSMENNNLCDILDLEILKEGLMEEIMAMAKLARRCQNLAGKRRPTMKEVAAALIGIQMKEDVSTSSNNLEDTGVSFSEICEDYDFPSTSTYTNVVVIAESSESSLLFRN